MRAVNLLPKDGAGGGKSLRNEDPAVVVGAALAAVVMIALVASFLAAHGKASAQQKELTAARLQLADLSEKRKAQQAKLKPVKRTAPVTPIVPPPAITGQEATWLSSVSQVLGQRTDWDRVLREVSLVMPNDVTLSSMSLTAPSTTAGAAPAQGFTISGAAYSYESVARLLTRLALVPDLSGVTLGSTSAGASSGGSSTSGAAGAPTTAPPSTTGQGSSGSVQFAITAAVKGPTTTPVAPAVPVAPAPTDTTATDGGA
jgi:Tfp pilus assembly protein PilN